MFAGLLAANEAVLDPGGLVDALVAEPIPVRNLVNARLEAVRVVALVASGIKIEVVSSVLQALQAKLDGFDQHYQTYHGRGNMSASFAMVEKVGLFEF